MRHGIAKRRQAVGVASIAAAEKIGLPSFPGFADLAARLNPHADDIVSSVGRVTVALDSTILINVALTFEFCVGGERIRACLGWPQPLNDSGADGRHLLTSQAP